MSTVGVVILTQGRRGSELAAAIASVQSQRGVRTDVVVVGNGWLPRGLPHGVRGLHLPLNVGIPAGRNAGAHDVRGEHILFLDDDERLATPDFLARAIAMFDADPRLGLIQPRIDATDGAAPRRWVPRLRKGDPRRSSYVFSCCEGAVVVRREAFVRAGRWPDRFHYAHEGIDLAFRLWDTASTVWYAGGLVALHPSVEPGRHPEYLHHNARNRIWVARRNLRWPISWAYIATWTSVQVLRCARHRQWAGLRPWWQGWRDGWVADPGPATKLRWRTVWRMARLGRPPIV